jgi:hypothetical protein
MKLHEMYALLKLYKQQDPTDYQRIEYVEWVIERHIRSIGARP